MSGPYLDIYALTARRDAATVDAFLDTFVDKTAAAAHIGGLELMMEPLGATNPPVGFDEWEWVPVSSLTAIVDWDLCVPRRTFTTYLPWCRGIVRTAVLSFTADNQLIVGIAVYDDEHGHLVTDNAAKVLLDDLMRLMGAHRGLILAEGPPPRTEAEFAVAERAPAFVFSTVVSS